MKDSFYLNISTADNLGIGLFKCALNTDGQFIITNSTLAKMLGYSCKMELKNETLRDLFLDKNEADEFMKLLKENGNVKFFETIFKNKQTGSLWVAISASKIIAGDKKEYAEGIIENIASHKETEAKLSLEKDFMQGLLDNIPDAIYFKDEYNRIIKVNKFYADGAGMNPKDILGKTDFDFFPYEQAKKMFEDDLHVLKTGKPIIGKIERTLLPNRTWNQVITTKIAMYDRFGKIIGTMGITRDMTVYANMENERRAMLVKGLNVLGKTLEMRDPYTFSHNYKVANISEIIGKELGWDENRLLGIRLAGELHDLGKIAIPLDILNKSGRLSEAEYNLIQEHVSKSYEIIKDTHFPFYLAETIYQHHERLDGSGYPRGLKENEISLEARILSVSDVLEAMTSHRPYRESLGLDKALEELDKGRNTKYDSEIVDLVFKKVNSCNNGLFWINN